MKLLTKSVLLLFLLHSACITSAQKYVLLDQHLAEPVKYSNTVTPADEFNDLFPVEKKRLPEFLKVLHEIESKLSSKPPFGKIQDYEIGCVKFTGRAIMLAAGERIDYVLVSICDNVKISMHLSDAKLGNESNAYFIRTWIKYIESNVK